MSAQVIIESSLGMLLPAGLSPPSPESAAVHAIVAALCCCAAVRPSVERPLPWAASTVLLLALAANALLHFDQQFVLWVRELARDQGWYAQRRPLQITVLALLLPAAVWAGLQGARSARKQAWDGPSRWASAGIFGLLALLALHTVSLHHTDLLLNARMAGASVGRWLETLALVVVGLAAFGRMRRPAAPSHGLKEFGRV